MEFQELEGLFPFPQMRPSQKLALEKFVETTNRERKYTILELPTGVGKSGIAVNLGRWAKGGGAYLLTIQKMLQTQYITEFPELVELKGGNNYRCPTYGTNCEEGAKLGKFFGGGCSCECPYRTAKDEFIATPFGVTNFAYFCTAIAHQKGLFKPRKLLIIDEAHNTESVLINHSNIEVTRGRAGELNISLPKPPLGPRDIEKAKKWLTGIVYPAIAVQRETIKKNLEDAKASMKEATISSLLRLDSGLDQFEGKLGMFVDSKSDMWFVGQQDDKLEIKPLTGDLFAQDLLFSQADHVVFLSATILDPRTFVRNLGISPKECGYLGVPSEFPVENRRIIFSPAGSMSFKNYEATLPKLLRKIEKILLKHPTEKGIIHCQSYKTMNHILNHFKNTPHAHRLLGHDPGPRSKVMALQAHAEREDGTVLLSPSMTEGLDLRDDLSRFQVIAKMPFASLGDPYIKTRMQLDKDWYRWQTALTLVQSLGRSVRSAEDHATSYIIDGDFAFFVKDAQDILPDWWLDSVEFK
jgi:Rad3-related DNA helicase